jgi:hypothetical protein
MIETITKLHELQSIDFKLDDILELRGDLPEQIKAMDEAIEESQEKFDQFNNRFNELVTEISRLENEIAENNTELKKDEENLYNVHNNKEYDALTKQINTRKEKVNQNKSIIADLSEKKEKVEERRDKYQTELNEAIEKRDSAKGSLEAKIAETEKEEKALFKKRKAAEKGLLAQQTRLYTNIRRTKKMAVALMVRQACSGCNSIIPLQKQTEIRNHKKLIVCETCGRIIIDQVVETVEN